MTDFDNLVVSFKDSMTKTVLFVNGNDQTDILTATGPVPSLAKLIRRTDARLQQLMPDITTRLWLDGDGQYSANQQAWGRRNLGLDKVDNVSDADKPVSVKQLQALKEVLATANSKEDPKNRNKAGGYFGYDGARLPIVNGAETFYGYLYNNVTKRRDWLLPDEDGEIALKSHITGTNSGVNTGDETQATLHGKLRIDVLSGENTGDETNETILEKLALTEISGVNTGDETNETIIEKIGYPVMPAGARGAPDGVAPLIDRVIPAEYLPAAFESVELVNSLAEMPFEGVMKKLYITVDDSSVYYWQGAQFMQINARMQDTDSLNEGSANQYFTQLRAVEAVLSSYVPQEPSEVTNTDKVVQAIAKLQSQIRHGIEDTQNRLVDLKTFVEERIITVTGDVSGSGTDEIELLIGPRKVTFDAMPEVASTTILGRSSEENGSVEVLTPVAAKTVLGLHYVDNTPDVAKPVSFAQKVALDTKENLSNKAVNFGTVNDTLYPSVKAVKQYADSLVVGLVSDRGNYDASGNTFPTAGGSGLNGEILKGNLWYVNVSGRLGGVDVNVGDSFRALADNPGQDTTKWGVLESNIGYVPYNATNPAGYISAITKAMVTGVLGYTPVDPGQRDADNGFAGLTGFRVNMRSNSGAFTSYLQNMNTASRTYTLPDKNGTVAMTSDITGTNSGVNTGDETKPTILAKLELERISGINTGDETKATILQKLGGETLTGVNTGDETKTTIQAKLGNDLTLKGVAPDVVLDEIDQTGDLGKWRMAVSGGNFRIDMNKAAARDFSDFSTRFMIGLDRVYLGGPVQFDGPTVTPRGTDMVAFGTLNLDNMSRNYAYLTGNNTVTTITLAEGNIRLLRCTGSPKISASAWLLTPTGRSLSCKPGDMLVVLGLADGVSQVIDYIPNGNYAMPETVLGVNAVTATTSLDLSAASVFEALLGANTAFVFDFSKVPALENQLFSFVLTIVNDGTAGRGVSFPANVKWAGGLIPPRTTTANGRDDWYFYSRDGVNWVGSLSNQDIR